MGTDEAAETSQQTRTHTHTHTPSKNSPSVCYLSRLDRLEEAIISTKAGLVILDSVASVVRKEFDTSLPGNLATRANLLSQEASTLKYLAHQFNIPVGLVYLFITS